MTPPAPRESSAVLSSASAEAVLPVVRGTELLMIDVTQVTNPSRAPLTIAVEDNGSAPSTDRLSLYPPDRPGRFSVRLSQGATQVRISLVPARTGAHGNVSVRLRVAPLSQPR